MSLLRIFQRWLRLKYLLYVLVVFVITFLLLHQDYGSAQLKLKNQKNPRFQNKIQNKIQHENTTTEQENVCVLAKLDKNNPEIMSFLKNVGDTVKCDMKDQGEPMATIEINLVKSINPSINCSINYFHHVSNDSTETKTIAVEKSGTLLPSDYGFVECYNSATKSTWRKLYDEIQVNEEIVKNAEKLENPNNLNVLIISFDSISHMQFLRKLPKAMKYFTEDLEGEVLNGYNIVGDGTPQAFIPILTGQTEEELPSTRKIETHGTTLDEVYPMIWKQYKKKGYVTVFGEDSPWTMMFSYRLRGFDKQPTTHIPVSYFAGASMNKFSKDYCIENRPQHESWLRTIRQVFTKYPRKVPKFMLMHHSIYSHDNIDDVQMIDNDLTAFFEWFSTNGHMENTLLVFMADHGPRFAKQRETQQGMLEERLPLMAFAAPKSWRTGVGKTQWNNLRTNVNRLSTPFDIHETLLGVLQWPPKKAMDERKRAHSLWHEISTDRSCADAGVDAHWCTCMPWTTVDKDSPEVQKVAAAFVARLNEETKGERTLCAELSLDKIASVKSQSANSAALKYAGILDPHGFVAKLREGAVKVKQVNYQLRLTTKPGGALYEATIGMKTDSRKRGDQRQTITVDLNAVSHVNKYGDLPHCVIDKNYFLAKWCVCKDKI